MLERDAERFAGVFQPDRPAHQQTPIGFTHDRCPFAPFLDLADDFLEQVLDGHQTGRAAEFIHHDRHLGAVPPHCRDEVVDCGSSLARGEQDGRRGR